MSLLIYNLVLIIVMIIAFLNRYFTTSCYNKNFTSINETVMEHNNKAPLINIFLITIILSFYSANIATSGKLVDAVVYTWNFLYRYQEYNDSTLKVLLEAGTEIGYLLLNLFIWDITKEPFWLFFIIAFFTTSINLYTASKLSGNYIFIMFVYLVSIYFFQSTYLLKQTIAVSFANLAFLAYLNNSKIKYFVFSLIATTFHATAIILLPLYFIFKNSKSKKAYFIIFLILGIAFILFGSIFNTLLVKLPYVGQYLGDYESDLSSGGGSLTAIFKGMPYFLITVLALLKRNKLKKKLNNADFFIVCSVFYSFSWFFTYNMYWFFRMGWFFLLPTLVLVPSVINTFNNPKERNLYFITFFIILITVTYRQIFITLN